MVNIVDNSSKTLLVLFLSVIACQGAWAKSAKKTNPKLPSFVQVCHRNDPKLNTCALNSFQSLRERLSVGIPELFIPPIEPLIIPEIKMDQDSGAVFLRSTYKNVKISGLSNFTINNLTIDTNKLKFAMNLNFSYVELHARYNIQGKIMLMPLMGEGPCNLNFTNVNLQTEMTGQEYKKHGRTYLKIKNIDIKYKIGKVTIFLGNLFNGDKALGERMNVFLNENWQSLSEEIRPLLEKALIDVLRSSSDKLFHTYSFDELLPK